MGRLCGVLFAQRAPYLTLNYHRRKFGERNEIETKGEVETEDGRGGGGRVTRKTVAYDGEASGNNNSRGFNFNPRERKTNGHGEEEKEEVEEVDGGLIEEAKRRRSHAPAHRCRFAARERVLPRCDSRTWSARAERCLLFYSRCLVSDLVSRRGKSSS